VVGSPLRDGNDFVTRYSGMPDYTYTIEYEDEPHSDKLAKAEKT
jgi:hypothetical protein